MNGAIEWRTVESLLPRGNWQLLREDLRCFGHASARRRQVGEGVLGAREAESSAWCGG